MGILKVGEKNLYHWSQQGEVRNLVDMPCVLDFYVEESFQRQGAGRALFDAMLAAEKTTPEQLAYDRPSPKLIRFLAKHCRLTKYAPQQNNFVLFDSFFRGRAAAGAEQVRITVRQHIYAAAHCAGCAPSPASPGAWEQ